MRCVCEGVRWGAPLPPPCENQTVYMDVGVNAGELCAVILCWREEEGYLYFNVTIELED